MPIVSMKTDDSGYAEAPESNPYGYGLTLFLNDDQCEALGIKAPMTAGAAVRIEALAFVKSSTGSVEQDGDDKGPDVRMELQITDMQVTPASKMYPNSEMT